MDRIIQCRVLVKALLILNLAVTHGLLLDGTKTTRFSNKEYGTNFYLTHGGENLKTSARHFKLISIFILGIRG